MYIYIHIFIYVFIYSSVLPYSSIVFYLFINVYTLISELICMCSYYLVFSTVVKGILCSFGEEIHTLLFP